MVSDHLSMTITKVAQFLFNDFPQKSYDLFFKSGYDEHFQSRTFLVEIPGHLKALGHQDITGNCIAGNILLVFWLSQVDQKLFCSLTKRFSLQGNSRIRAKLINSEIVQIGIEPIRFFLLNGQPYVAQSQYSFCRHGEGFSISSSDYYWCCMFGKDNDTVFQNPAVVRKRRMFLNISLL